MFKEELSPAQWEDLIRFEGNAQGFRLLNKERFQGLKLSAATLAAFTKYPRPSIVTNSHPGRRSQKKYGFFQGEKEIFSFVAESTGLKKLDEESWCRHPLAFLVEAADDICYNLIDLEDGCRLGLISYEETESLYARILREQFLPDKLRKLEGQEERTGTLRAMAIGRLIDQCVEVFLENEEKLLEGSFDQSLTDIIEATPVLEDIIRVSIEKIYRSPNVLKTEIAGFEVLPGLLEAFSMSAYNVYIKKDGALSEKTLLRLLPPEVRLELDRCGHDRNLYQMLMVINDLVSGMTDTHAISVFRQIKGISLPGL